MNLIKQSSPPSAYLLIKGNIKMRALTAFSMLAAMVFPASSQFTTVFNLATTRTCSANVNCGAYVSGATTNVCTANLCTTCNTGTLATDYRQCFSATSTVVNLLYTFTHSGSIDCSRYTEFRNEFRTEAINQLNGAATISEIVHLCATTTNVLHTSIRVAVTRATMLNAQLVPLITNFGANINNNVLTATATIPLSYMGRLSSGSLVDEQFQPCAAAANAVYVAQFPGGNQCYPVECTAGYTLRITNAAPSCLPSTAADASSVRVCSDNSNCMQFGDPRATCSATTGRCSCSNGFGPYTATPIGTADVSTYFNCFRQADLPLVAMARTVDLMFNIMYDRADCTRSALLANEYATLVNTILRGTTVVVRSIHHNCPAEGTLGMLTVIRVTAQINDLYSDAVLGFPGRTITGIMSNNHNLNLAGNTYSYFQIANIEQANTQCLTPLGSVLNAYFGPSRRCVAVTCSTNFEVSSRGLCVSTTPPPVADSDDDLTAGQVAGIIVGSTAFVVIVVVVIYCMSSGSGEMMAEEDVDVEVEE